MNHHHTNFQHPPEAGLFTRNWPVAVIGGGPAGSVCARHLAQHGIETLLLEKDSYPRDKVCGDLLISDSLELLKRIGLFETVRDLAHETNALEVFSPSAEPFTVPGTYLTLRRKHLDSDLARAASLAGATVLHAHVTSLETSREGEPARLNISGQPRPLRARIVILATGGVVDLAHRCGLVTHTDPSALAIRCYVRSTCELPHTLISYDESILPGYGWVIPLGPDGSGGWIYNLGCGTSYRFVKNGSHNLKKTLRAFTARFKPARKLMAAGEQISPVGGASLRCGLGDAPLARQDNLLAIGETIGTTYPFTGEGIGKAMESGLMAAETVAEALQHDDLGRLDRYRRRLDDLKPRYSGYITAEKWLAHPRMNDFVARRIARSRYLQRKVQEFMAETADPGALFNIASILKSYVK